VKVTGILLAIATLVAGVYWFLSSEQALLLKPKGVMARKELDLIVTSIGLMLVVVIPTFIALFVIAWRYRADRGKGSYKPAQRHSKSSELLLWIVPPAVIAVLSVITVCATPALDPYKPLDSPEKPLVIQVVALDWKWLFIYPEQGVAAL